MADPIREFLVSLREDPRFFEVMKYVGTHRPSVPDYIPGKTSGEDMQYASAKRQGFDLAVQLLTGVTDGQ